MQPKQIAINMDAFYQEEETRLFSWQEKNPFTVIGTPLEKFLLNSFPLLKQLQESAQERNGVGRYTHTLIMVETLMALRAGNYALFVRYNPEKSRGQKLTEDQFTDICCKASEILDSAEAVRFMLLLVITHDYGVLIDEKTHVTHSGNLCVEDFQRLGFSAADIELAKLINGNHDSLGSMLLGEVSPDHVEEIYRRAQTYRAETRFFQYLWLLTVLDINGSGDGYLTREKYDALGTLNMYESFNRLTQVWPEMRIKILRQISQIHGEHQDAVQRFNRVNMQYLYKLVTYKDVNSGRHLVSEDNFFQLIGILNILWDRIHQLNKSGISPQINYITFASDERSAAEELNEKLSQLDARRSYNLGYPEGSCQIYDYRIENDYLIILNAKKK